MRQRNLRLVITGGVMIAGAVLFFLYMMGLAPQSNDPKALMETVGSVSGVVTGLAVVMIIVGLIGTKKAGT